MTSHQKAVAEPSDSNDDCRFTNLSGYPLKYYLVASVWRPVRGQVFLEIPSLRIQASHYSC